MGNNKLNSTQLNTHLELISDTENLLAKLS